VDDGDDAGLLSDQEEEADWRRREEDGSQSEDGLTCWASYFVKRRRTPPWKKRRGKLRMTRTPLSSPSSQTRGLWRSVYLTSGGEPVYLLSGKMHQRREVPPPSRSSIGVPLDLPHPDPAVTG
jgi:hypothetical protein